MKRIIFLILILTAGAAAYMFYGQNDSAGNDAPPADAAAQQQAPAVSAIRIETEEITHTETLPGRTAPYKVAEIRPQVSGIVTDRLFEEGGTVEKGAPLYKIDAAPYSAAYERAQADLQSAEAAINALESRESRYEQLLEFDAVSRQEYDDVTSDLAQARAAVAQARANRTAAQVDLDYTNVKAPITGRIGKSNITVGSLVTANQAEPIARITQLDPIYVDLSLPGARLFEIRQNLETAEEGIPVRLRLKGGQDYYPHEGMLQFSDVTVDPSTGAVELRALFDNPEGYLLPGMFVEADLVLGGEEVFLVPQQAAIRGVDGNLSVWVIGADETVNPVPITADGEHQSSWIVRDGLQAGDMIVTEGFQKIAPGATVSPNLPAAEGQNDQAADMPDTPDAPAFEETAPGDPVEEQE